MANFTVTNLNDAGAGSLRQAILSANAAAGADAIQFQTGLNGTITLASELLITDSVTIDGLGADKITVSGNDAVRVFHVASPANAPITVAINWLTITKGNGAGTNGGAVLIENESVSLDHVAITDSNVNFNDLSANVGFFGGGIYVDLSAVNGAPASTFSLTNSSLTGNRSRFFGNAIYLTGTSASPALIRNSTFLSNREREGAIWTATDTSLEGVTVAGNIGANDVGGLYVGGGVTNVVNSIFYDNNISSTGGTPNPDVYRQGGTLNISYSIVGTAAGVTAGAGYQLGVDPLLDPVVVVGGISYRLPGAGSPAINAGNPAYTAATAPTYDQRGFTRVAGGQIDLGAVETGSALSGSAPAAPSGVAPLVVITSIAGAATAEGLSGTRTLDFTVSRDDTTTVTSVDYATSNGTALAGSDYVARSGTVSFAIGEANKTISITINGDTLVEPDETFTVTLSNPTGTTLGTAAATGTILNTAFSNGSGAGSSGGTGSGVVVSGPTAGQTPAAAIISADFASLLRYQTYSGAPLPATVTTPTGQILPNPLLEQQKAVQDLIAKVDAGALTLSAAHDIIVDMADGTTSVATMNYQFFTGHLPTREGLDYLVSSPQNPADLNDGYYAGMSLENRYINFAVNLGKPPGEGAAKFAADYGALSVTDAAAKAYATIFGGAPAAGKIASILTPATLSYLASLGGNDIGTKAAIVGYLLAEAAKSDLGPFAARNENFLYDLLDGTAAFGADTHVYDFSGPIIVGLVGAA